MASASTSGSASASTWSFLSRLQIAQISENRRDMITVPMSIRFPRICNRLNLTASTSISASAPPSKYSYEVFINHRGTDVRKTFVSHLYHRLRPSGLNVFLDQPEMERGEDIEAQIKGAIRTASVHVAIFSPRYAESRWCLDELVQMLSYPDATTIPVFYQVKPADLRWTDKGKFIDRLCAQVLRFCRWPSTENLYAKALLIHQKKGRYTPERIAAWKKALFDASSLGGFELDAYNGDEGQLLDAVVQQVMKKARKAPLHVATYPIGLGEKLLDFETMVLLEEQHDRAGPNFVGIVGPGGVGKTTLARLFFNTKKSDYERSCFLAEVGEAAATHTLPSHQRKLYQDLTGSDPPICSSTDEGIPILKRLPSFQALIILDDVDGLKQLEALFLPIKDVLPGGSLVLLTTQNKDILTKYAKLKESNIYNMTGLNLEHSQELFCSHAFQTPYPAVGYENLVREFLNVCQGLPLSLRVIGSELYGEKREHWQAQLRKQSRVVPSQIRDKLKIIYDGLDKEVKEIFLDVACFFIGVNRDTAIKVWDGSGWQGRLGVTILERRCLVTFDSENCIRMHGHLRDLGRDLADKEPPGCPRRLWGPIDKILKNVPTDSKVRGISVVQRRSGESFQSQEPGVLDFHIKGLQLLKAPADCLESLFNVMTQPELLWLRCKIDSSSSLPSNWPIQNDNSGSSLLSCIPITNLRVLELVEAEKLQSFPEHPIPILGTLWNTEIQAPPLQLRELKIGLELSQLPKSIEQLKFLEKIELSNFTGTLPEEFFHLRSLKDLRLRAGMTSLPDSLGNLTNLQYIDLSGCKHLRTLPASFGNLKYLQNLMLVGCEGLKKLPDSFMNLIRLKHLNLRHCHKLTLSGQILENIGTLERLDISYCVRLVEVGALPATLTVLDLNGCFYLKKITGLHGLPNLRHLRMNGCIQTVVLPRTSIRELNNLEGLDLTACSFSVLSVMPFFANGDSSIDNRMLRLKSLNLSKTRLRKILFPGGVFPVLKLLDLSGVFGLEEVGGLPTVLTSLNLRDCRALKKITGLGGLARLRYLDMGGCEEIEEIPGLDVRELNNIEVLNLEGCPISVVTVLPFVSVEELQGGRRLLDSSLDNCIMPRLRQLNLWETRITEISFGEGVCPVLEDLDLSVCEDLVEVGAWPKTLKSLDLRGCCALKKITGLRGLAQLRRLYMGGCFAVEELPDRETFRSFQPPDDPHWKSWPYK